MVQQRVLVVFLMTALALIGALHYPPLWFFVLVIPLWFPWWLHAEDERIHDEAIEQVRERLRHRFREDE